MAPFERDLTRTVNTTDATPTTIWTGGSEQSGFLALIQARQTGITRTLYRSLEVHGSRFLTSEASDLISSVVVSTIGAAGAAAWTAEFVVSGGNVLLQVTGAAATNITWDVVINKIDAT
jgi:hypothetical protein